MPILIVLIALGLAWWLDLALSSEPNREPTAASRPVAAPHGSGTPSGSGALADSGARYGSEILDGCAARPRSRTPQRASPAQPRIEWRDSVAVGAPESGRLVRGVRLPAEGRTYFTWDPILKRRPDRDWRRWGTDELVRTTLRVLRQFHRRHRGAPRVGVGDLSLPRGGYFGPEVSGGIGHASHQNGLDVDVYYPRLDRVGRPPTSVAQVDVGLSQDLVDLFVAAGASDVFVGPNLPLTGPAGVVTPVVNHDNHLHARFAP